MSGGSGGGSNIEGRIEYDDLREWLDYARRLGEVRDVAGASWQEDIGLAAEAVLRAENGPCVVFDEIPGCAKGFRVLLNVFAGTRRNMTMGFPDHLNKWELSQAYRESYLKDAAHRAARDRGRRAGARERDAGRGCRCREIPGARLAREGRRALYRHRHLQHHARSRGELAQRRGLSRTGARQEERRPDHGGGPSRLYPPREIFRARREDAGRDGAGRRSARVLLWRHGGALRRVRARHRRRLARAAR